MQLSEYAFDLPPELIAQEPLERREDARMLVVDRGAGRFSDSEFSKLPTLLSKGDLLVVNNTRVFPARLLGRTETGAQIEIFLIEEIEKDTWITLARPARRLAPEKRIVFDDRLTAEVVERTNDGKVIVRFHAAAPFDQIVEEIGRTPLPPYIGREKFGPDMDRERYQTVFARNRGAIAAPTAGLHFSPAVFSEIEDRGVEVAEITLHVGYGTFEPVRVERVEDHRVAAERFEIDGPAAERLEAARRDGRRVVAVGTTTTRMLEFMIREHGEFRAGRGRADLTILPGYRFRAIGALLTNFHLPESSLLILVATFGGYELIMESYRHAVAAGYRFYSYGDCMFIS